MLSFRFITVESVLQDMQSTLHNESECGNYTTLCGKMCLSTDITKDLSKADVYKSIWTCLYSLKDHRIAI